MNGSRIQIPGIQGMGMPAGPSPAELARMEAKQVLWNLYNAALAQGKDPLEAIQWAKEAAKVWVDEIKTI